MKKKLSPEDELMLAIAKMVNSIVESHFVTLYRVLETQGLCQVIYGSRGRYKGIMINTKEDEGKIRPAD